MLSAKSDKERQINMSVTLEKLKAMRHTLESDRELIGNDEAAKPFLDFQEKNIEDLEASWANRDPIDALDHVLSEMETGEIEPSDLPTARRLPFVQNFEQRTGFV